MVTWKYFSRKQIVTNNPTYALNPRERISSLKQLKIRKGEFLAALKWFIMEN
jgi:hypothetical protein